MDGEIRVFPATSPPPAPPEPLGPGTCCLLDAACERTGLGRAPAARVEVRLQEPVPVRAAATEPEVMVQEREVQLRLGPTERTANAERIEVDHRELRAIIILDPYQ